MDDLQVHDRIAVDGSIAFVAGVRGPLIDIVYEWHGHRRQNVPTSTVLLVSKAPHPLTEQDAIDRFLNGASRVCAVCGSHGAGPISCGGPGRSDITMCSIHAQQHHAASRLLTSQLVAA